MCKTKDRVKAITVYDINNDGEVEVMVGSEDRNVHVLDERGNLLWRYDTQHRVLALGVLDANQDGEVEIFVGSGNGRLFVLNHLGDLLWSFQANDRIRSVVVDDINGDGLAEILVGTEDRVYALQHLDQAQLDGWIEERWQALLARESLEQILPRLVDHPSSQLRAFVLSRQATGAVPLNLEHIRALRDDSSAEVKRALTEIAPILSQMGQAVVRPILDALVIDRRRVIRMALVDCFAAICQCNPQLGFEYLERIANSSVDLWVRHSVVRQLDHLLALRPGLVFPLLMSMLEHDKDLWIRQASARVLAHYLESHPTELLYSLRLLSVRNIDSPLWNQVTYCTMHPIIREVMQAFLSLSQELASDNVLERLEQVVAVMRGEVRQFEYGEIMAQMHQELFFLHSVRSVEEMAHYICDLRAWDMLVESMPAHEEKTMHTSFSPTLQVLQELNGITDALRVYLRREGLGERISSLLEAEQAIEDLSLKMKMTYYEERSDFFPDYVILRLLLVRWREIIHIELSLIRGRAELVPELGMHQMALEEQIVVPLRVQNNGSSSAEDVRVTLLVAPDEQNFMLIGSHQQYFETISANRPIQAEFTLKPRTTSLRLAFEITYDDAESKKKTRPYGFRLDLVPRESKITRLPNPYYTGTAVQNLDMFFGREQEIASLQEDFVYSAAPAVVVLYGQRRSGKSSLIYKLLLTNLLDPHVPVRIDMQHETLGFTIEKFFRDVAYAIHREARKRGYVLPPPDLALFKDDAVFTFDRFLDDIEEWLGQRKLVLLIDEFEVLDDKAKEHQIDEHLFDHLRSLVQERQCMHLLLAGTHRLEGLTSTYWSVFFNLANHRRLANLTPESARQLISNPMKEYLEYDSFAVEKIRSLTGDQPYLIQLFCHSLVRHCQESAKDYITINDVNIVLEEVKQSGREYFNWIWEQSSWEERIILAIIAQASGDGEQFVSFNDVERLFKEYHLSYKRDSLLASLRNLRNGDVIVDVPNEQRYKIAVGLTRSWLHEGKPIQRVILGQE